MRLATLKITTTLALLTAKLTHLADFSWVFVFSPVWAVFAVGAVTVGVEFWQEANR